MRKKLPRWLQIVLVIAALSIVGPLLAVFLIPLEPWLFAGLYLALAKFPGKNPDRPRIQTWSLWLLAMGFFSALMVEIAILSGRDLLAESGGTVTQLDVWIAIASSPILWFLLYRRSRFFIPVLCLATAVSVSSELYELLGGAATAIKWFESTGHILSDGCLVWAFVKYPPHAGQK
ncbi:MAG: hypothetical protein AAB425_10310 [Bdellovibrionota bacterium]